MSQKWDCRIEHGWGWMDWRALAPFWCQRFRQAWDRFLNWCWFWTHHLQFRRFLKKVAAAGYDPNDIWWSRKTGFFCFPPFDEDSLK